MLLSAASELCVEAEAEEFLALDTSNIKINEHKKKKVERMIRGTHTSRWNVIKIALVACLIVLSLGFTACVSIPELREAIYKAIVEWREGHVGISFDDPSSPTVPSVPEATAATTSATTEATTVTAPLAPVTPPTTIESKAYPSFLPEECYTVVECDGSGMYVISGYKTEDDSWVFSLTQMVIGEELHLGDNENQIISNIQINGCNAVLIENQENPELYGIVWRDGYYDYQLYGCFSSRDVAIEIASGVIFN